MCNLAGYKLYELWFAMNLIKVQNHTICQKLLLSSQQNGCSLITTVQCYVHLCMYNNLPRCFCQFCDIFLDNNIILYCKLFK